MFFAEIMEILLLLMLWIKWALVIPFGDFDTYVVNDTDQNIFFSNDNNGAFTNTNGTDERSHTGDIHGKMGTTWGDFDNDGDLDLLLPRSH